MKFVLVILSGLLFSPFVMADEKPCEKDVAALCAGVEKGGGAIMKCLHENKDKLSEQCKAHRDHMKGSMKQVMKKHRGEIHEACAEDFKTLCGEIKPGHGAMMKCLRDKKDQASEACQAELSKMKADMRDKMKKHKK
ncbi:MAG: hypothetical protein KF789_11530 [Bdellovibrionaceae bacterium]|nr:hypothetical protein [Pseudobdellovibrionaceae bacterium]